MKTADLAILAVGTYVGAYFILPELAKKAGEGVGNSVVGTVKEVVDSGYHFVRANIPQATIFTPAGTPVPKTYISYTPALIGPLSSKNPDDWRCWLV